MRGGAGRGSPTTRHSAFIITLNVCSGRYLLAFKPLAAADLQSAVPAPVHADSEVSAVFVDVTHPACPGWLGGRHPVCLPSLSLQQSCPWPGSLGCAEAPGFPAVCMFTFTGLHAGVFVQCLTNKVSGLCCASRTEAFQQNPTERGWEHLLPRGFLEVRPVSASRLL